MTITGLRDLHYETFRTTEGKNHGRLLSTAEFDTGITGYHIDHAGYRVKVRLTTTGKMRVEAMTEWDFGSFALDTPDMVRASLPHDMLCLLTNMRLLPWKVRAEADALFRQHLKELGPKRPWYSPLRAARWWRWAGVATYSQAIARWKDKR